MLNIENGLTVEDTSAIKNRYSFIKERTKVIIKDIQDNVNSI